MWPADSSPLLCCPAQGIIIDIDPGLPAALKFFHREREFRAIEDAVRELRIETGMLLSNANEKDVTIGGVPVKTQSISEWLLSQDV